MNSLRVPNLSFCPKCTVGTIAPTSQIKADDCAVCLEALKDPGPDGDARVEQLDACGHQFHIGCIAQAVAQDPRCPLCRADVGPANLASIQAASPGMQGPQPVPLQTGSSALERAHGPGWDPTRHYHFCGQSCPCCRWQVEGPGGFGVCGVCERFRVSRGPALRPAVPVTRPQPRHRSFMCVVARRLGPGPRTLQVKKLVLLMGHKPRHNDPWRHLRWGLPGGLYDATDRSPLFSAVREFGEEMGLIAPHLDHASKRAVVDGLVRVMQRLGQLQQVVNDPARGFTCFALVVPDALAFEAALRLPAAGRDVKIKASTQLSSETKGYTWVTKYSVDNQRRRMPPAGPGDVRYSAVSTPMLSHPLRLRAGTLGAALNGAFQLAR